ncbi:hypothetical protein [Limosilactobacillus fastidiosus]|uniref:Uncharacterized protein n=1 Tax=Limosilactobacillus fastidiosus TaxID=2759855 RepID=A0A7W3YCC4_9LACO|nr:hypothetical protein [Limosilactobacillus fastidiosus]MBB1063290.1 hypothetical protein [Limosilactobacillus fastidiosus]MBB1086070.1 hypothetical protein [Limosilactobacillus fastidiosus]MCD7084600.1 hypothetical protein [Limosilactobacillus fastidiosus]MCD7086289.1 hypothetical protein [Limosilactobacillus fastidiosus]MCD7114496.1 hypothetical protein [Limosilactobacillus fastidiosus]
MQRKNRSLIILGIGISLVTIVVVFTQFIYGWENDTLSNVIGTLAGGIGSIIFIFWRLDYDKRNQEILDIINLLNLIDEFPTLISEQVLRDSLREKITGIANFRNISKVVEEYRKELHAAIDKAETSLLVVGYKKDSNLQRFLRETNIVQLTLRELIELINQCEGITQDESGLSKKERVLLVRKVERKKFYVISSLNDLIKDLEQILKTEGGASEINLDEIMKEISNFNKKKYERIFEKIEEVVKNIQPERTDKENNDWYSQSSITDKADLIIPVINKEKLTLPSDLSRYYRGKEKSVEEEQEIIKHFLFCMALLNRAEYYQTESNKGIEYCFDYKAPKN